MSETTTRNALLSALIGGTDYPIAFENSHPPFDPEPHELWLAQYYLPTSGDSRGKGSNSSQERGIYQVSIFIKASLTDYDNTMLQAKDEIKAIFSEGTILSDVGGDVLLYNNTSTGGSIQNGWFKTDLSFNFATYQTI